MTELVRMQQRRGTAQQWASNNPILAAGEIGFEFDTKKFKIGNGQLEWNSLEYFVSIDQILGDLPPETLDTIKELADAINNDPDFLDNVLSKSGGTMTGSLILANDPEEELEAATKNYVDEQDQTTLLAAEGYADSLSYSIEDLINVDVSGIVSGDTLVYETTTQTWFAGPSTAASLEINDINDVSVSTPENNDLFSYDSTSSEWINRTASEAGIATVSDLSGRVSVTNGTVTTASTSSGVVRNIYTSTSAPSGGMDGDIWIVYS
jgi:hypothetical protein